MPENPNNLPSPQFANQELNKPLGAREFVMRYLKYLPWLLLSIGLALLGAFLKNRYSIPIYQVQSSLIINNDRNNKQGGYNNLGELFMFAPSVNLNNEIEILKSRPFIERVVRDLDLQTYCYSKGNIRSTLLYGDLPFELVIQQHADSSEAFGFMVNVIDSEKFTLNENRATHRFGEPFVWSGVRCLLVNNRRHNIGYYQSKKFLV